MSRPKVFVYKVTVDDGIAPCPQDGLLTLGVCKPAIRRNARRGDYLVGVGSIPHYGGKLIYVAQVDAPIPGSQYYHHGGSYWSRWDCIYKFRAGRYVWQNRGGRRVHLPDEMPAQKNRDVGFCGHRANAIILPCSRFVYFGRDQAGYSQEVWSQFPHIEARVRPLKQSHLVHHSSTFQQDLEKFCDWVLQRWPGATQLDEPHSRPSASHCHDSKRHCAALKRAVREMAKPVASRRSC
jgi:hypothetical protein